MDTVRSLKKDWVLSEEAFNLLLRQLDADRQCAGEKYEHLRRSLIKFFAWRGSRRPDADADEAIDRVARKLSEGERVQEIYSYTNGVARLVLLETLRDQERE
ncbi:MAG TPA: hypothetical protein VNO70_06375, partial [Blastocatellia bacterium]|nr:hypothetical protein [Blastocatellia bacterium]